MNKRGLTFFGFVGLLLAFVAIVLGFLYIFWRLRGA